MSRLLVLATFSAGCFSSTGPDTSPTDTGDTAVVDPDGDPATVPLNGMCPLESRWGGFEVEANESYSVVDGEVANGVVPLTILEQTLSEGDCKLLKRNNPYCDPPCGTEETCDFDGECIPYPENQNVGTVTVGGLTESVSMEPTSNNNYFFTKLSNPAFTPGKLIALKSAGGAYAPFTLQGVGVAPLVPTSTTWIITAGQPLQVAWDAPPAAVRSEVYLSVNVDQHGLTPATLVCTFADDGAAEVPSSVMDALLGSGVTGYPSATIQRRTADKAMLGAGCVDFVVDYEVLAHVSVTGHTPCSGPDDCPEGQECNMALQTCE